jgi:hypothetical protein
MLLPTCPESRSLPKVRCDSAWTITHRFGTRLVQRAVQVLPTKASAVIVMGMIDDLN